jgi:hypothetical protein
MGIRERILARRDLDDLRVAKDITALAEALNADAPLERGTRFITARAIIAVHQVEGRAILRALRTAATQDIGVEFVNQFLGQEAGLDIGDPDTWANIDLLVGKGALSEAQGALLKSLALAPVRVTQEQVSLEMYHPDGTEK